MGFRFSLEHVNWLAHLLQPAGATPELGQGSDRRETLRRFLETFERNYYPRHSLRRDVVRRALHDMGPEDFGRGSDTALLSELRWIFRDIPWVALLVPSGFDHTLDRVLTDRHTLDRLVHIRCDDPGLILQIEGLQDPRSIRLDNVFPAFKVALENATRWPGVLVWAEKDAAFLPLPRTLEPLDSALEWIFSHLATTYGHPDLGLLQRQYLHEVEPSQLSMERLNILHLSDIHLGSKIARLRLPRVKTLIRATIEDLGEVDPVVPVVTGDLMDSPTPENLDEVRSFAEFLHGLGVDDPIFVLGNHDVRKDGWMAPIHEHAVHIERDRVVWKDEPGVGIASFNSVAGGDLARGSIGEREFADVGDALDRHRDKASKYALVALLHHHPIPVDVPPWYKRTWYERLLGGSFDKTEELQDAHVFLQWAKARRITAVLHGHKHIPRFSVKDGMSIIGCGSSVGKVDTSEKGHTYVSMNVVTIDPATGELSCRLRAERIPGAGFDSDEVHEIVGRERLMAS